MVPMANRPTYAKYSEVLQNTDLMNYCNLHYHADIIEDYFGDGSNFGVTMSYSKEQELLGTAGGVKIVDGFE